MNRAEFMGQLERLLEDIPAYERQDALDYYNDYFDEAGPENEEEVIRKLGSPKKVAAIIKTNLVNGQEHGEFTEYGYRETAEEEAIRAPAAREPDSGQEQRRQGHSRTYQRSADAGSSRRGRRGAAEWTLIIIGLVFASPFILGVGGGILGVLLGILGGLIGIVFSVLGAGLGLFFGGLVGIVKGMVTCFGAPAMGIMTMGLGFLSTAFGILCLVLFAWALKFIPRFVHWARDLISRIFHRRQGGMQG